MKFGLDLSTKIAVDAVIPQPLKFNSKNLVCKINCAAELEQLLILKINVKLLAHKLKRQSLVLRAVHMLCIQTPTCTISVVLRSTTSIYPERPQLLLKPWVRFYPGQVLKDFFAVFFLHGVFPSHSLCMNLTK